MKHEHCAVYRDYYYYIFIIRINEYYYVFIIRIIQYRFGLKAFSINATPEKLQQLDVTDWRLSASWRPSGTPRTFITLYCIEGFKGGPQYWDPIPPRDVFRTADIIFESLVHHVSCLK